jgi:signal transduction histidine kinase/CheY-like chemotaxis protein
VTAQTPQNERTNGPGRERDTAFNDDLARIFHRIFVGPTLLTSIVVVVLSERPPITLACCFTFLAAHWLLSVDARQRRSRGEPPSALLGPIRLAFSMVLLPCVVISSGPQGAGWLVAAPALFAHAFFAGAQPLRAWMYCVGVLIPTLVAWTTVTSGATGLPDKFTLLPAFGVLVSTTILATTTAQVVWDRWWRSYEASLQLAQLHDNLRLQQDQVLQNAQRVSNANTAKTAFLAHVSHELRTPMNGVLGSIELLALDPLTPNQAELVANARQSAQSMLTLLNGLLDLSKVEAGHMELESTSMSIRELVDGVVATLHPLAAPGVRFTARVDPMVPDRVVGDPTRLRQIIMNLAGNALKFTHQGAVTVFATVAEPPTRTHAQLVFEVRDTGIGIPADRLPHLFEAYTQADPTVTRRYGGTGLGLALVRELVQLMGGSVRAQSAVGQGSAFTATVTLPLLSPRRSDVPKRAVPTRIRARSVLNVLVVDDNASNRLVAVKMLERLGHEVRVAPDGLAAIESYRNHGADVILMDCFMPRLDGFEATQRIRRLSTGATVPVIGMTASTAEDDLRQCRRSGMNGMLPKPFNAADLAQALRVYVGRTGETIPELPESDGPDKQAAT